MVSGGTIMPSTRAGGADRLQYEQCEQSGGRTFWLGDRLNHRVSLGLV